VTPKGDKWLRGKDGRILLPTDKKETTIPWVVDALALIAAVALAGLLLYGC